MSRKKILLPLTKRHTHRQALALGWIGEWDKIIFQQIFRITQPKLNTRITGSRVNRSFLLRPSVPSPKSLGLRCVQNGIPHQLKNTGAAENRYLLVFSPAGFENFIDATAVAAPDDAAAPTEPPAVAVQNVMELAASYGIHFG
jgi:hypothetical protein